ncbi:hypothetical protein ACIRBX_00075 [Kitasatospora sp. NPDC096147]|uniref:hypothetical protein n=1 Tax=Kitasatospora sp. NPDC096147 TaxID=3364093 RepID=UPI00382F648B
MGFEEEAEQVGGHGLLTGPWTGPAPTRTRAGSGYLTTRDRPAHLVRRHAQRPAEGRPVLGHGPGVPDDQGELLTVHLLQHVAGHLRADGLQ